MGMAGGDTTTAAATPRWTADEIATAMNALFEETRNRNPVPDIFLVTPRIEVELRRQSVSEPIMTNRQAPLMGMAQLFGISIETYADLSEMHRRYLELRDAGKNVGVCI